MFEIAVICSTDCELTPISAKVALSHGGSPVESQQWTAEMLAKIKRVNHRVLRALQWLPLTPAYTARSV